jgi:hypothetical protein
VYEAIDVRFRRRCAIKSISITNLSAQRDEREDMRRQIEAEAHILAQHASQLPFMPHIYDILHEPGYIYLVMEYVGGKTLDQIVTEQGRQSSAEVEHFMRVLLRHLAQLHAVGIVHRDLKPQNIKATPHGRCPYMVLDFGIAKQGTLTLVKAGSPDYASPEQRAGYRTDERADLYSLAATAYYLLAGISPFQAMLRTEGGLPPPSRFVASVPQHLEATLMRMLQPNPDDRPRNAAAALALLSRAAPQPQGRHEAAAMPVHGQAMRVPLRGAPQQPKSTQRSRRALWAWLPLIIAVLIGAGGYWAWRERADPESARSAASTTIVTTDRIGADDQSDASAVAGTTPAPVATARVGAGDQSGASAVAGAAPTTTHSGAGDQPGARAGTGIAPTTASAAVPATAAPSGAGDQPGASAVAGAPAAPTPAPVASTPPAAEPTDRIVFASNRSGNFDLYTVDPRDPTDVQALLSQPGDDNNPVWSPDGRRIAFTADPDGNGRKQIYVVNVDGGNPQPLTTDTNADDDDPSWSPDGKQIVFTSNRNDANNRDVYLMEADGTNLQPLLVTPSSEDDPEWSPDGATLAFVRRGAGIFMLDMRSRAVRPLIAEPTADDPAWSPDGKRLAFTSITDGAEDIYVTNTDGSNRQRLTTAPGYDTDPAWSPDGTSIVFAYNERGRSADIFIVNANGGERRPFVQGNGRDIIPVWSP